MSQSAILKKVYAKKIAKHAAELHKFETKRNSLICEIIDEIKSFAGETVDGGHSTIEADVVSWFKPPPPFVYRNKAKKTRDGRATVYKYTFNSPLKLSRSSPDAYILNSNSKSSDTTITTLVDFPAIPTIPNSPPLSPIPLPVNFNTTTSLEDILVDVSCTF